ncbi:hypothetical protein CR513_20631, partial [Mucuna pruriens]
MLHEKTQLNMEKKGEKYAKHANKGKKEVICKKGGLAWVHLRKERFPHLRKSKLLPKGDGPFKILKKIRPNLGQIPLKKGRMMHIWEATVKELKEATYRGRLKRIQEEVQLKLATLMTQKKPQEGLSFLSTIVLSKKLILIKLLLIVVLNITSLMGELKFFFGLQIKQAEDGIYIHQT